MNVVAVVLVVVAVVAVCNQQELLHFYWDLKGGCPMGWWWWGCDDVLNGWPKRGEYMDGNFVHPTLQIHKLRRSCRCSGTPSLGELCRAVMGT